MSTIKTILAPVSDAASAPAPLEAAFRLADLCAAHVTVLHVMADPTTAVPLVGEGMSGAMVEEMLKAAEKQARETADGTRAAFEEVRARHGIVLRERPPADGLSTQWVEVVGQEEDVIARRGRLHDLVVMGHAGAGRDEVSSGQGLNAALLDSGKALLLAPAAMPATFGKRVVIAWNGSAESSRAVAAALPLLERADEVAVLTVNEQNAEMGGIDLVDFLGWHGIAATHQDIPAGGNAGIALLESCRMATADLLVMGAYTHSRLRQLILGGVTRHVMHKAEIPVLLSH